MVEQSAPRARYGEAFWRAHHEAWKRSDLNQRVYCESQGVTGDLAEGLRELAGEVQSRA
jgi:hypothetical protein